MSAEDTLSGFKRAVSRRSQWEDLWDEIYDLMLPMQEGFFQEDKGEEGMELIYDETGVVAIQQFASQLQSRLVPNFDQWIRLVPGIDVPLEDHAAMQPVLDEITRYVMQVIHNSNFSVASFESFLDVAVGTAGLQIQPDYYSGRIVTFNAIPQPQLYIMPGPGGTIGSIYRVWNLNNISEARTLWPKGKFSENFAQKEKDAKQAKSRAIECVKRDFTNRGGERWNYSVVIESLKEEIVADTFDGAGSNPILTFRWTSRPGEVYGRGPAVLALPAVRVANLVTKLTMENADIQIGGMWQLDDDGTVNVDTIEIASGTIIPRLPNTRGLESIAPGGRIEFGDVLLSRMQEHIRDIFYNENLGSLDKTPISATEAALRDSRRADAMGSGFGRLNSEFVNPVIQRVVYLLKKEGRIELPQINGRDISILSTSPLARGMKFQKIQDLSNMVATTMQLLGPQRGALFFNDEEIVNTLREQFDVPSKMITTKQQRQQAAEQLGQAAGAAEAASPGAGADVIDLATRAAGV